jgi:putative transcriptional regulator
MIKLFARLLSAFLFCSTAAVADTPAPGKLLVATDEVRGPIFAESVILVLSYSDQGALGLVVNRPTDVTLPEIASDDNRFHWYEDPLFWGGPVEMHTLRALLKTDAPPEPAAHIFGSVFVVPVREESLARFKSSDSLRLFMGYAGWGPGQLDRELHEGSWRVLDASDRTVFSAVPEEVWQSLSPRPIISASLAVHKPSILQQRLQQRRVPSPGR